MTSPTRPTVSNCIKTGMFFLVFLQNKLILVRLKYQIEPSIFKYYQTWQKTKNGNKYHIIYPKSSSYFIRFHKDYSKIYVLSSIFAKLKFFKKQNSSFSFYGPFTVSQTGHQI